MPAQWKIIDFLVFRLVTGSQASHRMCRRCNVCGLNCAQSVASLWETSDELPLLLCCCLLQLLPLLTKAWHYPVSAVHAYLAAMLMRFSLRMTQALPDSSRDGYDAMSSYGSLVQSILYLLMYQVASTCVNCGARSCDAYYKSAINNQGLHSLQSWIWLVVNHNLLIVSSRS